MSTETTDQPRRRFRRDIEGLRALAVVFVLIHHASASLLPGGFAGVDMFFVVSGFVITTQLVREVERTGTINLPGFYARRAKRLLPAAALVLVFTAVSSWLFVSRVQWSTIGTDIAGAALYVVNWVFAARSVDYLAEDVEPSPVQHFWSLAVEEQFYIIWPLLIIGLSVLGVRLAKRSAKHGSPAFPLRATLALGLVWVVVLPSLAWSIYYTATSPQQAYFVTTTRLWELGIGALVAVLSPTWERLSPKVGSIVAWVGLVLLVGGVMLITLETPWPGSAALVPTVATALVMIGGFQADATGPVRVLGLSPLVWIGGLSYSLYLWHWPILRTAEWIIGDLNVWLGLLFAALSVIPAWVGYHLVEKPVRYSRRVSKSPRLSLSLGMNFTLIGVVGGLVLVSVAAAPAQQQGEVASPAEAGEGGGDGPLFPTITPDPAQAAADIPDLYDRGCQVEIADSEVISCPSEVANSGDLTVALVGDSKAAQWASAFDEVAAEEGWRLVSYTKSSCSFTDAVQLRDDEPYEACAEWGVNVEELLTTSERPDVVVKTAVAGGAQDADGNRTPEALAQGYASLWDRLGEEGIPVIAMSDTPQPGTDTPVYECVADNMDDPNAECSFGSGDGSGSEALRAGVDASDNATYLDMNQHVCPDGTCPAVYRNVLTYRQGSHITDTLVRVLTPELSSELVPEVERLTSS